MNTRSNESTLIADAVVLVASIFTGFGVAHLIVDFLYGLPAEFNLSDATSQFLALAFFFALTLLIARAARNRRASYRGLIIIGLLLAVAGTLEHAPDVLAPGPFRSGLPSTTFSIGMIMSGLARAGISWMALKTGRGQSAPGLDD